MIKSIVFDWGGVLIDNPVSQLVNYFANILQVTPQDLEAAYAPYQFLFYKGLIDESEFIQSICSQLNVPVPQSKSLWKTAVQISFKEKRDVFDLITQLRAKKYKTALLSNTEVPTVEYYYESGYEQYFDEAIFSCHEKMAKPDAEIYQLTLNRLKNSPEEVLLIDDRDENVEGAKQVGMHGILFNSPEQLKRDLTEYII